MMNATISRLGLVASAATMFAFAVQAEDVDHVELTCDTCWTIPAGQTKHVEYLEANRPVRLTVDGGGTLELAVVEAPGMILSMKTGKVKVVRPVEMKSDDLGLEDGDWTYHLDASRADTITLDTKLRDGVPALTTWAEVDGRMHPHTNLTFFAKISGSTSTRPYYREAFQNGLNVVDLGPFRSPFTVEGATNLTCWLAYCGNQDKYAVTNHMEVFSVWQDHPDARNYTPTGTVATVNGPQAVIGATAFYRGKGGRGNGYALLGNSGYSVTDGEIYLDDVAASRSTIPDDGWHVLHLRGSEAKKTSSCGCLGMVGWKTYAGARYGEIWSFSKKLDVEKSTRIRRYLQSKWLGPAIGTIELTKDATYESDTLLRGRTIRVAPTGTVWDDCDFVLDGATDLNGDGLYQMGELRDLRHTADTNSSTHQLQAGRSDQTLLITEDLPQIGAPYDETTYRQTCVGVRQKEVTNETGEVTLYRTYLQMPKDALPHCNAETGTNDIYTVLLRFRINRYHGKSKQPLLHANAWSDKITGGGPLIQYLPYTIKEPQEDGSVVTNYWDAQGGYLKLFMGSVTAIGESAGFVITNGWWCEAALVVSNKTVHFGFAKPNGIMTFKDWTSTYSMTLAPKKNWKLFSELSYTSGVTIDSSGDNYGSGDVALFAQWSRALSDAEVREAFSRSGAAIMQVGVPGLSRDLFNGEENFSDTKSFAVDALDWSEMPRSIAPGARIDINFRVPGFDYDLSQCLRVGTTVDSAEGTIRATIGGEERTITMVPGGVGVAFFPGTCFPTNTNLTLSIVRTDSGSEPVELDFVQLAGSWRLGHWDYMADFSSETTGWQDHYLTDRSTKTMRGTVITTRTNETGQVISSSGHKSYIYFNMPADLRPERCTARIAFAARDSTTASSGGNPSWIPYELKVNGEVYKKFHFGSGSDVPEDSTKMDASYGSLKKRMTIDLPKGALQAGENCIELGIPGQYKANGWIRLDTLECELLKVKLTDPLGMTMFVK